MAVVINEFEVAPQERGQLSSSGSGGSSASAQPPKPEDIERAVHRQHERLARVRAH
jgi:hypothetical protein